SALWTSPDGGATCRKSADLPGPARWMWIDPRSIKADRTVYVAGLDAVYRRQAGGWRTGGSPGVFTDVTGTPPRFYATSAGKIFVSADGGMTWSTSSLSGFRGRATAIAASRQQPDVAYVSYSELRAPIRATRGVAKTVDGGRHWTPVWHNVRDAWLTERFNAGWVGNPVGLGVAPGTPDVVYATYHGLRCGEVDRPRRTTAASCAATTAEAHGACRTPACRRQPRPTSCATPGARCTSPASAGAYSSPPTGASAGLSRTPASKARGRLPGASRVI